MPRPSSRRFASGRGGRRERERKEATENNVQERERPNLASAALCSGAVSPRTATIMGGGRELGRGLWLAMLCRMEPSLPPPAGPPPAGGGGGLAPGGGPGRGACAGGCCAAPSSPAGWGRLRGAGRLGPASGAEAGAAGTPAAAGPSGSAGPPAAAAAGASLSMAMGWPLQNT